MPPAASKRPLFVFEALGSLACGFYGNYVFFLFRDRYGFGNLGNLGVAALMGLVIALAAWQGGRFAERCGCFKAMFVGLWGMMVSHCIGVCFPALAIQLAVMVFWAASQFIVWPALETLVSGSTGGPARARLIGVYSVVWASCSALSYFFGGALFDRLGNSSIFWLPLGLHLIQIILLRHIERRQRERVEGPPEESTWEPPLGGSGRHASPASLRHAAWLANPFASVAAFTLLAMIPETAGKMGLTTTTAGWFCSVWFFARLGAFVFMWRWPGWHYRFRWLLGGYLMLIAGFGIVLTADDLLWLGLGQMAFGLAVGVLYYASLFYSMDVGNARAEQGGIHEAMMGAGNFVGPGIGALGLLIAPQSPDAGVWSVGGLLAVGLAIMLRNRLKAGS